MHLPSTSTTRHDRRRITMRQWRDHLQSLSFGGEIRKAIRPRLHLAADSINKKQK